MAAGLFQQWLVKWKAALTKATPTSPASAPGSASEAQLEYVKGLGESRKRLEEESYKGEAVYDRTLITLSGGALAVSLAFIKDIVPEPALSTVPLLCLSWGAFAVSLLLVLVSMLVSQKAFDENLNDLDNQIGRAASGEPATVHDEKASRKARRYCNAIRWLNRSSGMVFILGTVLFVVFASANMLQGRPPENDAPVHRRTRLRGEADGQERHRTETLKGSEEAEVRRRIEEKDDGDTGRQVGIEKPGADEGSGSKADGEQPPAPGGANADDRGRPAP